jgi:segregation and condensation protein A
MVGLTHLHAPRVSIREQAYEVVSMLRSATSLSFRELIASVRDRGVLIARFLSVLELYRLGAVSFEQTESLGPLQITWRAESFDESLLSALGADYDS